MTEFYWASGLAIVLLVNLVFAAIMLRRRERAVDAVARSLAALDEGRSVRPVLGLFTGATGRLVRKSNDVLPGLEQRFNHLEENGQLLQAVLGGMTEGVVAIDARRRLLFANDAALRLFGLGPDVVGHLITGLIRSPKFQEAVDATLVGPDLHQAEISVPRPEARARGQSLILAVQGTPLPGSPPSGAVLVFHDVTETRRLERVRQDFVANASHELKTPLASIKAYTETLLDWALHDERVNAKFLRRIEEQVDRMNSLVFDLLSLARLESHEEYFQHVPVLLAPIVNQAVEAQRSRAEAKRLEFTLHIESVAERAVIRADEDAIRPILDNLIDNAIKYTPDGGRVRITVGQRVDDNVNIEVADTGIGIPRPDLPRLFERFYRVDKARSRELGGTGLGLSIVKHLVQSLGGNVSVDSRLGCGSTFSVRLPTTRIDLETFRGNSSDAVNGTTPESRVDAPPSRDDALS